MSSFSRNKNERILEEEAVCFQNTQTLTSEYVVRVGSQRWALNARRSKEALPWSAAWSYWGVMEQVVKAGLVLAGLGTDDLVLCQGQEKHQCSINFFNTVQEESRNK